MPTTGYLGSLAERIARRVVVDPETGCWVWTGKRRPDGYGVIWGGGSLGEGREVRVHRASYEAHVGPIPAETTLDHLCRNRACANPAHLEAVSRGINVLRGEGPAAVRARQTHCRRGHEFTPENTYVTRAGYRNCRECHRLNERVRRDLLRRGLPLENVSALF